MTKCLGPHHHFHHFTTSPLTTSTTSPRHDLPLPRLVNDLETLRLCDFSSFLHCTSLKSHKRCKVSRSITSREVVPDTLSYWYARYTGIEAFMSLSSNWSRVPGYKASVFLFYPFPHYKCCCASAHTRSLLGAHWLSPSSVHLLAAATAIHNKKVYRYRGR